MVPKKQKGGKLEEQSKEITIKKRKKGRTADPTK